MSVQSSQIARARPLRLHFVETRRGSGKDRDDADYLFRSQKLDAKLLRERYEKELRHNLIGNIDWHDGTLKLWIEIFEAPR
jgi:hypothetical protein